MIIRVNCNSIGHCPSLFYQALWSFWGLWTNHVLGSFCPKQTRVQKSERGVLWWKRERKRGLGSMNFGKGADFHALYPGSSGENNRTMVLLFLGKKRKNLLDFLPLGLLINIHCMRRASSHVCHCSCFFALQWDGRIFHFANAAFVIRSPTQWGRGDF